MFGAINTTSIYCKQWLVRNKLVVFMEANLNDVMVEQNENVKVKKNIYLLPGKKARKVVSEKPGRLSTEILNKTTQQLLETVVPVLDFSKKQDVKDKQVQFC